jgi:sigma-B regulation protein RsbQ
MAMSMVQRNNVRVMGEGTRTLVLAHGFGTDQKVWHYHAQEFAKDRRVVLFDHVGAGGSDQSAYSPHRYNSLRSYADDLLALLAELDLGPVDYVGHSMGAMVGLLAAQEAPERFGRMVFVGASPRYLNDVGYVGGFEQSDIDGLYAAMVSNFQAWASGFAGGIMGNAHRPELASDFATTLQALRPDIALGIARVIFQSDHRLDLAGHTRPTLIVQSQNDPAVPVEVGHHLASHIPHASLQIIDAQGHLPHLSAPAEVMRAMQAFLH